MSSSEEIKKVLVQTNQMNQLLNERPNTRHRRCRNEDASGTGCIEEEETADKRNGALDAQNSRRRLTTALIQILLQRLRANVRNVLMRFLLGTVMITLFSGIIYLGPLAIALCILFIQIMCFHEIISLGHIACKANNIPFSRWLSWYFLITSDFYLFGESIAEYFGRLLAKNDFGQSFLNYHLLLSYSMYITGFVTFVINLKKRLYTKQFTMFGITHITLLMIVIQSHMMIKSLMQGIVWFLLPALLIICNDSFAYVFGFFFGQTPLIRVSPKKTWEGFIGGAISTVIFGFLASAVFARYPYMVCPVRYYVGDDSFVNHCEPSPLFSYRTYEIQLPVFLHKMVTDKISFELFPFQLHAIFLSLFASLISPFNRTGQVN